MSNTKLRLTRTYTRPLLVSSFLLSVILLITLVGCNAGTTEDVDATATSSASDELLDSALEELFWIAADAANISRQTPYPEARDTLAEILWNEATDWYLLLEKIGIDADFTVPFCISYHGVAVRMYRVLEDEPTITESAAIFANAIDSLQFLEDDVDLVFSEDIPGRVDVDLCNQVVEEILLQ
jgi:hypothetical protein